MLFCVSHLSLDCLFRASQLSENLFVFLLDPRGGGLEILKRILSIAFSGCEKHHEGEAILILKVSVNFSVQFCIYEHNLFKHINLLAFDEQRL